MTLKKYKSNILILIGLTLTLITILVSLKINTNNVSQFPGYKVVKSKFMDSSTTIELTPDFDNSPLHK